jgi:parvulin-like peptidyl-prolyl isomerase
MVGHPERQLNCIRPILYGVFCVQMFCFIIACDGMDVFSRPYVATVSGAKIYLDDYEFRLKRKISVLPRDILSGQDNLRRFEEEILNSMITEKIMFQRAQELNITISDAELDTRIKEIKEDYGESFSEMLLRENIKYELWKEDVRKEMLLQKLVAIDVNARIKISEDETKDYFKKYRKNYNAEPRVRVSQIVVRNLATAKKVEARLKSGEDFARVAQEVSIGPEASRGGDLGFITGKIMPEPLDKTIFNLPLNKISPIIKSPYGFHIVKVLERRKDKVGNFKDVRDEVMADIQLHKEDAAFAGWLEGLQKRAIVSKKPKYWEKISKLN